MLRQQGFGVGDPFYCLKEKTLLESQFYFFNKVIRFLMLRIQGNIDRLIFAMPRLFNCFEGLDLFLHNIFHDFIKLLFEKLKMHHNFCSVGTLHSSIPVYREFRNLIRLPKGIC